MDGFEVGANPCQDCAQVQAAGVGDFESSELARPSTADDTAILRPRDGQGEEPWEPTEVYKNPGPFTVLWTFQAVTAEVQD